MFLQQSRDAVPSGVSRLDQRPGHMTVVQESRDLLVLAISIVWESADLSVANCQESSVLVLDLIYSANFKHIIA